MKNDYEIRGEVTAIFLKSKKHGTKETLIDTVDFPKVSDFVGSWFVNYSPNTGSFYVAGVTPKVNGKRKGIHLHRLIMDFPNGLEVDHRNNDTLDNRRSCNLRAITNLENKQNRKGARKDSSSGVRGVTWNERFSKWVATIQVNNKQWQVGIFKTIEEAEKAVREARAKHMPFSKESLSS